LDHRERGRATAEKRREGHIIELWIVHPISAGTSTVVHDLVLVEENP
jgi:hypothetical protein